MNKSSRQIKLETKKEIIQCEHLLEEFQSKDIQKIFFYQNDRWKPLRDI